MTTADLLDPDLRSAIETHVKPFAGSALESAIDHIGEGPLAIKYGDPRYAASIGQTGRFHISSTLGFTWGTGVYCTPLLYPMSTAIYGRVGSVASFDPTGWRIYDATNPHALGAYIGWLHVQPLYGLLAVTVHAQLANQLLRNHFRETFNVDCVLFHPDQADTSRTSAGFGARYTNPSDLWMCVADFDAAGYLRSGDSDMFRDARPCVAVEEQFVSQMEGIVYAPLLEIGTVSGTWPSAHDIATAHATHTWVRVLS